MAIAFVQKAGANSTGAGVGSITVTPSAGTAAGNTLFLFIKSGSGVAVSSITDTKGNTWTVDLTCGGTHALATLARCANANALTTGDTITINFASSNTGVCVTLAEFSGLGNAATLDQTAIAENPTSVTSVAVGPTPTTTVASELALTVAATGVTAAFTWTPPAGWTEIPSGQANNYEDAAYQILSGTQTLSATWQTSQSGNLGALIATYKGVTFNPTGFFVAMRP